MLHFRILKYLCPANWKNLRRAMRKRLCFLTNPPRRRKGSRALFLIEVQARNLKHQEYGRMKVKWSETEPPIVSKCKSCKNFQWPAALKIKISKTLLTSLHIQPSSKEFKFSLKSPTTRRNTNFRKREPLTVRKGYSTRIRTSHQSFLRSLSTTRTTPSLVCFQEFSAKNS